MSVYSRVPIRRPRRTAFPIQTSCRTMANIGNLIPTCKVMEMVPGDTFTVGQSATIDMQPTVAPFKGDLYYETWAFFVPNDMLEEDSDDGKFSDILLSAQDPENAIPIPTVFDDDPDLVTTARSLWDYIGCNIGFTYDSSASTYVPNAYIFRGYYKIWNDIFRDENLQEEVTVLSEHGAIMNVNYKKDRFTSAFTSTQKGNPIQLPINVTTTIDPINLRMDLKMFASETSNAYASLTGTQGSSNSVGLFSSTGDFSPTVGSSYPLGVQDTLTFNATSSGVALTINDLRLANKLQLWLERNQLCGTRYKEYLLSNYGIAPNDETLQMPAMIGHSKVPIIVNSVVQNVPTSDSVASTKTGNAIGLSQFNLGKWTAKQFGWLYVLSALRPKANYSQGMPRSYYKSTVYDFFNPIFENLGQQPVYLGELYQSGTSDDLNVFGYQDIYNEMRYSEDMTTGGLQSGDFESWSVFRKFSEAPSLGSDFITVDETEYDYLFSVPSTTAPQAIISANTFIKAVRPISKFANPSLGR